MTTLLPVAGHGQNFLELHHMEHRLGAAHQRTGTATGLRRNVDDDHMISSAGAASSSFGKRRSNASRVTSTSRAARCIPRHRWAPTARERCGQGSLRWKSISHPLGNTLSSRLATWCSGRTGSPARMTTPPLNSTSSFAQPTWGIPNRKLGIQRHSSSMAAGSSAGASSSSYQSRRSDRSTYRVEPSCAAVVSKPARNRESDRLISSASFN